MRRGEFPPTTDTRTSLFHRPSNSLATPRRCRRIWPGPTNGSLYRSDRATLREGKSDNGKKEEEGPLSGGDAPAGPGLRAGAALCDRAAEEGREAFSRFRA